MDSVMKPAQIHPIGIVRMINIPFKGEKMSYF